MAPWGYVCVQWYRKGRRFEVEVAHGILNLIKPFSQACLLYTSDAADE